MAASLLAPPPVRLRDKINARPGSTAFTGADQQRIDFGDLASVLDSDVDFTVECIFKTLSGSGGFLCGHFSGSDSTGWYLFEGDASNEPTIVFDNARLGPSGIGTSPAINVWRYLAFVHRASANTVQAYYATDNGPLVVGTLTSSIAGPTTTTGPVHVGCVNLTGNNSINGRMVMVRQWNRALETNEIRQLHHRQLQLAEPQPRGLIFWWDAGINPARDLVGGTYGTLSGTSSASIVPAREAPLYLIPQPKQLPNIFVQPPAAGVTVTVPTATLSLTSFAPQIQQAVSPPTAALALTTFAPNTNLTITVPTGFLNVGGSGPPSVIITNNQLVVPPTLALNLTGLAPTVINPQGMAVPTASLTTTTFSPTIALSVSPPTASLSLSTFAPVLQLGVSPPTLALTTTSFAPTITTTANQVITPPVLALTTTAFAPTVSVANNQLVTPPVASLTITPFAPTVVNPQGMAVPTASLTTTTFVPVLQLSVSPATLTLTITSFAPVLQLGISPLTLALTTTTFAPTIVNPASVVVPTASLTTTTFAPSISVSSAGAIVPPTANLSITTFIPTVVNPQGMAVPTASLTTTTFIPTIQLSVSPPTRALTITAFAPTISTPVTTTPPTAALSINAFAPTITTPTTVTPPVLNLTISVFAPSVGNPVTTTPNTITLNITTFAPVVTGVAPQLVTPPTLAIIITPYAPTVSTAQVEEIIYQVIPATYASTLVINAEETTDLSIGIPAESAGLDSINASFR